MCAPDWVSLIKRSHRRYVKRVVRVLSSFYFLIRAPNNEDAILDFLDHQPGTAKHPTFRLECTAQKA